MLNPKTQRVDYGLELRAPEGYELDSAIAATYTLDLNALLTVPVALCFHDTLEGEIQGERLALLEAIGQLKGRLRVFYQAGKIKHEGAYNRLFALLEPWLKPIVPSGGVNSSFHPKFWLLRYTAAKLPVRYRLIVLSRNLTFDRSWDLAVSLDGELGKRVASAAHSGWCEFVGDLLSQAPEFAPGQTMAAELAKIVWYGPKGMSNARLLAGGPEYGQPLDIPESNDSILVVSPFLKDSAGKVAALDWLADRALPGQRWLFSRAEELDDIGEEKLQGWCCYAINTHVVDGEERLELGSARHNLHAKLIVTQGKTCHWHLGSANATAAALGRGEKDKPRNTELMVRLAAKADRFGPSALMADWLDHDNELNGLFVKHQFTPQNYEESDGDKHTLRRLSHQLIKANWVLQAAKDDGEPALYSLLLKVEGIPQTVEGFAIDVSLLSAPGLHHPLDDSVHWDRVNINQISAFLRITITAESSGKAEHLVLQAALTLPKGTDRERRMIEQLVDSEDKFLNYIRLLLQSRPDKNGGASSGGAGGQQKGLTALFGESPIFEQLMNAAARDSGAIERIQKMVDRLEGTAVPIPKSFATLWSHFSSTKK